MEKEIIDICQNGVSREKLNSELKKRLDVKDTTIKSYISHAKKKGYIEEVDGKLRLRGKWRFFA